MKSGVFSGLAWRGCDCAAACSVTVFHDRRRFLKADHGCATDTQLRYRHVIRVRVLIYDEPHSGHYSASDGL
ncbi:TPA: hypothetical protein I7721_02850 [Vibrio vulnificus]|nr:hypothetical protein [Vibrio vulnificus]